ncbi:LacI family DNA-binding transcriptional regulator [Flavobacterium nackdongense]|uniref:LacI family transcriptional regulator n=1 Tax=Flavobacterium nackdongense TaxID=2547394 RepID=A0A4P6YIR0_9FLAO|nr:LacI family DNA-binding transcriptional regulator [Flavobacterium nackdongense]QBN20383.1 LacI family transcriptional regulator [Flavobacterium nackdongense]
MIYITIKDIAKKLNISIATVSRAFNDKSDIKIETKNLILKTAKEMGYRPNPMAKKLIQKRSLTIGIVVPEFLNSFFPEVIIGAQEILFEKGYQVLITQSNENFETELKNVKALEDSMVDGIIISQSSETKNVDYYQNLINSGFPIVFFNRVCDTISSSKILFNDYKWAFFATEHLINQGYKNIYHLKGKESVSLTNDRLKGFMDAHAKHKLSVSKEQIVPTGFRIEDGQRVALEIIDSGKIPDAIFASNDPSAIGAMQVFKKKGFKIPQDIAFVGFTESRMGAIIDPPLTSVLQPAAAIGREAARILIEQIENPETFKPQIVVLNGELNIRDSSVLEPKII